MNEICFSLALLLTGGAISLAGVPWPSGRVRFSGYWTSIIGCAVGFAQTMRLLAADGGGGEMAYFHWMPGLALAFGLDQLSLFFMAPVFGVGGLALVYSTGYFQGASPTREAVSAGFVPFTIAAMAGVLMARDMVSLALMWEAMAILSFILVMSDYEKPETQRAGYLYLIFSQAGALFLAAALGVWASASHGLAFNASGLDTAAKTLVCFLALVAFGSKAGLAPLHVWLPHAHPAAPSHVSALLSGALIKMGVYGVLRFHILLGPAPGVGEALFALGGVTAIMGGLYALGQDDIKRALAYSSVENIGVIFLGVGLGMISAQRGAPRMAALAFTGALLCVWNHALFKTLLFLAAGAVYQRTGTRKIEKMGGLLKSMPATGALFLTGAYAIIGLPPLNGFAGEFFIYMAGFQGTRTGGIWFLPFTLAVVILAVTGGLAVACFTRLSGIAFLGQPRAGRVPTSDCPASMRLAMIIPAALCVILGLAPSLALPAASPVAWALTHLGGEDPSLSWNLELAWRVSLGSAALLGVFAAVFAARRMMGGKEATAPTWGCGFSRPTPRMQYTGASFAAPIMAFGDLAAPGVEEGTEVKDLFPPVIRHRWRMVDLAERTLRQIAVRPAEKALENLRWIQHGKIHWYVAYILAAIVALLLAM
jgi:hydrogenase-4 component B